MLTDMENFFTNSRRKFIKTAAMGAVTAVSIPEIVAAGDHSANAKKVSLGDNDTILFQGDSITDAGRDRMAAEPNTNKMLGAGYVFLTAAQLLMNNADKHLKIYNRGISGNKVYQLAERWDTDCLALKPTILSIHIGVNNFWHTILNGYKGNIDTYTNDYKALIDRTIKALPGVKIIICEPFALRGTKAVTDAWYPTFDLFRKAAKDIAATYDLPFVPYQSYFDKALQQTNGDAGYWTADGVHPTIAGAELMAQAWLKVVK